MRICLFLAGLFVFVIVLPQSSDDKKSREIYALNRIKNQISWDYAYDGNQPSKNGIRTSVTYYSSAGDIEKVISYNVKGQVINTEHYSHDKRGNKTEYSRFQGTNASKAAYQKIAKYNDVNQVIEETGYDGVEYFNNIYRYNEKGELSEIRYLKNSVISEKRIFARNGSTTTVSIYNAAGSLTSRLLLRYDSHNNLFEEAVYGVNQSELEKKTYHYDENKNLKEEARYKLDKIALKTNYSYNASGNLLDISEEMPGTAQFIKKSFTYDSKNNLLEIRWRRKSNEEFNRISYSYDQTGMCTVVNTWYPATKYRVMTRYTYELY